MDRIEDETVRFLYFLQPVQGEMPEVPMTEDDWPDEESDGDEPRQAASRRGRTGTLVGQAATPTVEEKKVRRPRLLT